MNSPTNSLEPFEGELKKNDLLHLLRRCLFGTGHKELAFFKDKKLEQCLDILLNPSPEPPTPVQEDSDVTDPLVPQGQVWVNAPYENDLIDNRRGLMLKMGWVGQIINREYSLTEKMTLFWHNHFVTEMDIVKDSRYSYRYMAMLRSNALGNFKKLIREGTTNIAMLVYLNGNSNSKTAPNENYARELMELFTLGKAQAFNYTEDDVRAAARVLSGWKDDKESLKVYFDPALHDTEDKQFSSFFNNKIIKGKKEKTGAQETDELIEMLFQKEETAKFVCRNLYRWFVSAYIDAQIEDVIIKPLARIFIANNYEIIPVIRTLLGSEHFFDLAFRGCIVKSPVDFLIGAMQQFDAASISHLDDDHIPWLQFYFYLGDLSMDIGNPPSVAGWPAYYQPPKFHQWWINSASLGLRMKLMKRLFSSEGVIFNGPSVTLDFVHFASQLEDAANLDKLIESCVNMLLAVEISVATKSKFKMLLLSNQESESYWTQAWNKFISNPNDKQNRSVIETRLRLFFQNLTDLPEYQMM